MDLKHIQCEYRKVILASKMTMNIMLSLTFNITSRPLTLTTLNRWAIILAPGGWNSRRCQKPCSRSQRHIFTTLPEENWVHFQDLSTRWSHCTTEESLSESQYKTESRDLVLVLSVHAMPLCTHGDQGITLWSGFQDPIQVTGLHGKYTGHHPGGGTH